MKKLLLLMLFAFLATAKSVAQCDSSQIKVTIYFKTDTFLGSLAYSLRNSAGKIEKNSLTVATNEMNSILYLNPIVYPHPTSNEAIMEFYNPKNERFDLEIFDI